ncbi:MAG: putative metalloprotease [Paracoccaceae bacterium]|jgi:predicted metalloprotease
MRYDTRKFREEPQMKWQGRRRSRNIEDRRRSGASTASGVGGIGVIVILVVGYFLGVDVTPLLNGGAGQPGIQSGTGEVTQADERAAEFVAVTLGDTEEIWADVFRRQVGDTYDAPTLVLFKGATQSPCGGASAATGPFYCPADRKVYLDTDFFTTLERQLGARGDFAAAYVVAHEVAHHVQNELGILGQANQIRAQSSETDSNAISVRIELQADCYAGVWARGAQAQFGSVERGDIAEAMNAAAQIGDDTLQRNAGRVVRPEGFTHGTSDQRQRWFQRGYESGDMTQCDTFGARQL